MDMIIGLLLAVALLAWVLFPSPIKKKRAGHGLFLPGYYLCYSDAREQKNSNKNVLRSKLLKSEKDDISGKPDYIYKHRFFNRYIPVELKSGDIKSGTMPHKGDLYQLGAYFLIIEEVFGVRPKEGRLIYKDAFFIVRNTGQFRKDVRATLCAMRKMLREGKGTPNASFAHCRHCILNGTLCEHSAR